MSGETDIRWESVYQTLADARRREVLEYLRTKGGRTSLDELADFVLGDEHRDDPTVKMRTRADLYHVHLPKLSEANLIDWNGENEVSPSPLSTSLPGELVAPNVSASPERVGRADD